MNNVDCIFCKIVSKDIPSKILYEDDDTISFLDAFPDADDKAIRQLMRLKIPDDVYIELSLK